MFMIMHVLICAPHGFDPFCMASVHVLLEGSWRMVKWFMLKPHERASVSMLVEITRILERQSEHSGKSPEEDIAETFSKQGPKDLPGLQIR
ncbi:hypothetical protein F511_26678 [Dorcoceras hygrometricum]|uniref:Uncharacterized protein n=1 Tax=Dorcoceras hygrometricum TaxID=472368 RepID=A0A2Z7BU35_9LAMI|nr:hypothetical protein F511_26678 [Dorcoceras hygrometricum]